MQNLFKSKKIKIKSKLFHNKNKKEYKMNNKLKN